MKRLTFRAILLLLGLLLCTGVQAQTGNVQLNNYIFNDGSTIRGMADNGQWAVAYGPSATNGSMYHYPKLINVKTKEVINLLNDAEMQSVQSCYGNDVTDNGTTIVGEYNGKPAYWTKGKGWKTLPLPTGWTQGQADALTPDGKYAVGRANDYGESFREYPVMWDLTLGTIVSTPNFPTTGVEGSDDGMVRYYSISSDGRYIVGCVSFSYVSNVMYFVYDRNDNTWIPLGFNYDALTKRYTPLKDGIAHMEDADISADGKWIGGTAYMVKAIAGSQFGNEYRTPFRYDLETKTFELYDDAGSHDMSCVVIDNHGTLYAATPPNTPVRTLYVRNGNYWYPLTEILSQCYGINYYEKTGFEYSGTPIAISGDGKILSAIASASDENYTLTLPETFGEAAAKVNLLNTYTITPASGSEFTTIKSIAIKFNREIDVIGERAVVSLSDEAGNVIRTSIAFSVNAGNDKTVDVGFRTTTLEAGKKYYVTIPAGTISLKGDATRTNNEIKIAYNGRAATPVKLMSVAPASGSSLSQLSYSTNPILLTFDTNIKLAESASAELFINDEQTAMAKLEMEQANNMLLIYPTTTEYLYKNNNYKVVLSASSVTDVTDGNGNEKIEILYEGSYERLIVSNDTLIFKEDFAYGVSNMLLYEGDNLKPTEEMKAWDFTAEGRPWVPVRDDEGEDFSAASHSMYSPAGKSDDWLMTPKCYIPDTKCVLEFDAQSYLKSKNDRLKVIVYASEREISMLTSDDVNTIKNQGTVIFNEVLTPGANEGVLTGDWTHYSISLQNYAEKSIYVAFVNENENQSAVFVDNIRIVHDNDFIIAQKSPESVITQNSLKIEGRVIVKNMNETYNGITLRLLDANGNLVDEISDATVSMKLDDAYDFTFAKELPLTIGIENKYAIAVKLGNAADTLKTSVKNLSFKPTKRVVIEEVTGQDCVFCPQGKVAMEKIESIYGDLVIPIEYHTYTGDPLESGMSTYSQQFLGLTSAPTAKINRRAETYSPMTNVQKDGVTDYMFSSPNKDCWLDVVEQEMATDADANLDITASFDEATGKITMTSYYKFAISQDKLNIGILPIVVEDNLAGYQYNNFYKTVDPDLGPWQQGGLYGDEAVLYTHNDVARGIMASSYFGQTGIVPTSVKGGETYESAMTFGKPSVENIYNCKVVCMMIDANTGRVINVARAKVVSSTGIEGVVSDKNSNTDNAIYTIDGRRVFDTKNMQKGLYIIGGKKVVVK